MTVEGVRKGEFQLSRRSEPAPGDGNGAPPAKGLVIPSARRSSASRTSIDRIEDAAKLKNSSACRPPERPCWRRRAQFLLNTTESTVQRADAEPDKRCRNRDAPRFLSAVDHAIERGEQSPVEPEPAAR